MTLLHFKNRSEPLRVISVTSGKGGVGKTLTSVHLAVSAQRQGQRVLLLDGDMGLGNIDVVLGLTSSYTVQDVLDGRCDLEQVVIDGPLGIKIIPGGSGIARLANLTYIERVTLIEQLIGFREKFDLLIIDTGAGLSDTVLQLNAVADEILVVTTPEPHAMTDAYAMIKVLHEDFQKTNTNLIVNMVKSEHEAKAIHYKLASVAKQFLGIDLAYLGYVPSDPSVQQAVAARKAATAQASTSYSGQAWNRIMLNLIPAYGSSQSISRPRDEVWRELIWSNQEKMRANRV